MKLRLLLAFILLLPAVALADSSALILTGVAGSPEHAEKFTKWTEATRKALVDKFGFQGAEEALHRRVIPAVCLAAHRWGDGGGLQDLAVIAGGVLTAADALLIVKRRSGLG